MNYLNNYEFYNTLSENTEKATRIFCDKINKSSADVYIVMAQKAACLFNILVLNNRINKKIAKKAISSSAIDYSSDGLKGKKVIIMDDIIVSGTSISAVVNKLLSFGVNEKDIEIITLIRNIDYNTMDFSYTDSNKRALFSCLESNDAECIEVSYDISHIIAYHGMTYDTDFPSFSHFEINKSILKSLISPLNGSVYNVSNNIHETGMIDALVLFPNKSILNHVYERIKISLENLVHFKIRLYIKNFPNGKQVIHIVPMALLNEVSFTTIENMFKTFSSIDLQNKFNNLSINAKTYYIQYYLANILYQEFIQYSNVKNAPLISLNTSFAFGKENVGLIQNSLDLHNSSIPMICGNDIIPDTLGYSKAFDINQIAEDDDEEGCSINESLFDAFKWWYETQELPARLQIKEKAYHFIQDIKSILEKKSILKLGFSLNSLISIVQQGEEYYHIEHLVSLFLDRSIDQGIVVPLNYVNHSKKCICRAYRHGEDLPFGEADKIRLLYYLLQFDNRIRQLNNDKEEKIASVSFEKMIVLFYQMSLKDKNILNRFLGFDNAPILQQRYSVHGIVASVTENHNYDNRNHIYLSDERGNLSTQVTNIFRDQFINHYNEHNKKHYSINRTQIEEFLGNNKLNCLSEEIMDKILLIANLTASWYYFESKNKGKDYFKDSITALTSCNNIFTFSSSLATAVHYFNQYWKIEAESKFLQLQQGDYDIEFYSNRLGQTLPSARKKHDLYLKKTAEKVFREVDSMFEAKTDLLQEKYLWRKYNRNEVTTNYSESEKMTELKNQLLKYLYFYSYFYERLLDADFIENPSDYKDSQYYQKYSDIVSLNLRENYFHLFDEISKKTLYNEKINYYIDNMDRIIKDAEICVEELENQIASNSLEYTVHYNSGMIISLRSINKSISDNFFKNIWNEIVEDENKTKLNILPLNQDDEFFRYIVAYENYEKEETKYLFSIVEKIIKRSRLEGLAIKVIFLPAFPNGITLLHNIKSNITKYAKTFLDSFLAKNYQIDESSHFQQISLVRTWNTTDNYIDSIQTELTNEYSFAFDENRSVLVNTYSIYQFNFGEEIEKNSKATYSTVKIYHNKKHIGTGVIIKYDNCFYCVSCQHILDRETVNYNQIMAKTSKGIVLKLKPLNYMSKNEQERNASEETLLFEVQFQSNTYLDGSSVFSSNDKENVKGSFNENNYRMFGYGKDGGEYGNLIEGISCSDISINGFILLNNEDNDLLKCGLSGSPIFSENNKIIGIHTRKKTSGTISLAIPIGTIISCIHEQHIKEKNNERSNY